MLTRRALLFAASVVAAPLLAKKPMTRLQVEVTDHRGDPVERAAVIVRFVEGRSMKKFGAKQRRQWEMKTNYEGVAKFPSMPQGTVRLQVIADKFQTYGATIEILEEERTIQVELNPPQPQYSVHE